MLSTLNLRLRAYYCPCCGARLDPGAGAVATCSYCEAVLEVEPGKIEGKPAAPSQPASEAQAVLGEPPTSLVQRSSPRFELSLLSQLPPNCSTDGELLAAFELSLERFALIYLRITDKDAHTRNWPLPVTALTESLESYGDPGLAANRALESLCEDSDFRHRLEVIIALFDPSASSAVVYAAGCRDAIWWMSSEEGRAVTVAAHHPALERKMLREQRDYFSNKEPLFLASGDLLVMLSAAYCGRGGGPYDSGLGGLAQALNESLGDDPLRVVTRAKASFWSSRAPAVSKQYPVGPLQIAAVQALPRVLEELSVAPHLQQFGTALFELCLLAHSCDFVELVPLHNERWALIWASNEGLEVSPGAQSQLRRRVLEVLDRRSHGDNENPRRAGRYALEELTGQVTRLTVIQLFDEHARVKYFRWGWKQPVILGPRSGRDSDGSIQQFDEGGEASLPAGARLFFPGNQTYAGQPHLVSDFAKRWPGGKASLLYGTLREHWKTPPSALCLTLLARALVSDLPQHQRRSAAHLGMAVVTGK